MGDSLYDVHERNKYSEQAMKKTAHKNNYYSKWSVLKAFAIAYDRKNGLILATGIPHIQWIRYTVHTDFHSNCQLFNDAAPL